MESAAAEHLPRARAWQSTRSCARLGQRELSVSYDERRTSESDVTALLEAFAAAVARGERFQPGDVLRIGWVPARLESASDGTLALVEPDFDTMGWVRGVDSSLLHLRAHRELAAACSVTPQFPSIDDRARVCSHLLDARGESAPGFVLDRDERWVIACDEDPTHGGVDAHAIVERTLHEIAHRFPMLIDLFALPVGASAAVSRRGEALVQIGDRERFWRCSAAAPRLSRVMPAKPHPSHDAPNEER